LLFRQGVPPHASYLFKHALVQDAAYGTLLREPRRALHSRIAETLEGQFAEIAESQPEILARHCTEAGLIEKAAGLWGKAGQRSLDRSALLEATAQLNRALAQIATLPGTAALRREQIKLQVALANALMHTKGYAASDTNAALYQARLYIERAEALGEPPEDPLLLFSVLYGFWAANNIAFNGDVVRDLAAQFLALAEKQAATVPLMIGHRLMGLSLLSTGYIAEGRAHHDEAIALYDPAEHRPLATRFGQDIGVAILCIRSWALWFLGYPDAALRDTEHAVNDAREIGQAATLTYALYHASGPHIWRGNYAAANALVDELIALADEKGILYWKALGMLQQAWLLALTGRAAAPEAAGERRHVTVMFCDLVDSTGIAARLDAEEWRDLVGAYLDAATAAVTEMGGKVAKKLGDGLMALFGYPVAQENDAERAVRAALAIQRALAELNRKNAGSRKPALAARIAIESGPVVVDAAGEIFGDAPNIAARAQALAEPGAVVVTARVQRQVAVLFVAEERGSHALKGVPEPVALYRIVRASGGGRRAGQRHLTPLVGRDEEIAMLMRRWERARQGDGQLVMIVGEPGLGKSRLIEEIHARLREVPHTWVEWNCSQLLQSTPLYPIAEWGRMRTRSRTP
jgi:class 3 adenylate cyclase